MPILPLEPNVSPINLFDDESFSLAPDSSWRVLHTKPRQEKTLARKLHELGIPYYLPLISRRLRVRSRLLTSHLPLFPGYVFLWSDWEGRHTALATSRVVRVIDVGNQERLWGDLRQINRLITSGLPVTPEDRLVPGSVVEIRSGPLAGLRGTVLRSASSRRFLVSVDFIQRGASVLLDDFVLAASGIS